MCVITPTRGAKVMFAGPQSYEMTPRAINHASSSEQTDSALPHQSSDILGDCHFSLSGNCLLNQDPTSIRNIVQWRIVVMNRNQKKYIIEAHKWMTSDLILASPPRPSIGEINLTLNTEQNQQTPPQGFRVKMMRKDITQMDTEVDAIPVSRLDVNA